MAKFSRRDFFKVSSAFLAFIPTIRNLMIIDVVTENSELYPAELQNPPPPPPANVNLIAEKYESGIAQTIAPDHIVIKNYKGQVKLHISDETVVWDDIKWVGDLGCEIGDEVVAWGLRLSDNSLQCEKLYFNIVNFIGEVSEVNIINDGQSEIITQFVQHDRFRGRQLISIVPFTLLDDGMTSRKLFKERPVLPKNQETVQVIGRTMKNGTTLAIILYLSQ